MRQRQRQSDQEIADSIAKSNAAVFATVAASLIRGMDGDPGGGGDADAAAEMEDLTPGVLCFDEVNVNDPFTALALKGECGKDTL